MITLKNSLLIGLGLTGIALTATPGFSQSTSVSTEPFQCGIIDGQRTTFAYNAQTGTKTPLIRWKSEYISENLDTACKNAANQLKISYSSGRDFKILVDGTSLAPKTAVCLINGSGKCGSNNNYVFFTVKSEAPLDEALPKIVHSNLTTLDINELDKAKFRAVGRIYYPRIQPRSFWEILLGR